MPTYAWVSRYGGTPPYIVLGAEALRSSAPPWRLMRARNKWQTEEGAAHHPYPGTYPVGGAGAPEPEPRPVSPRRGKAQARVPRERPAIW